MGQSATYTWVNPWKCPPVGILLVISKIVKDLYFKQTQDKIICAIKSKLILLALFCQKNMKKSTYEHSIIWYKEFQLSINKLWLYLQEIDM
jgi:hypothetical protein